MRKENHGHHPIQAAIYARVSSEHQADAQTIASQVAAVQDRVATDGLVVPEVLQCLEDGYSGATLVRPALERLRDAVAAGEMIGSMSIRPPGWRGNMPLRSCWSKSDAVWVSKSSSETARWVEAPKMIYSCKYKA